MGYRDAKVVRRDFDELGEGCFVEIKNPMLRPLEELLRNPTPSGDVEAFQREFYRVRLNLVTEWCVWDIETDKPLPVPSADDGMGGDTADRIPAPVMQWIKAEYDKAFPQ